MSIVYNTDKRSGITYAYESKSYWDKEKQQSRSKRTLIGRVDPETGEIKKTDGRCKKEINVVRGSWKCCTATVNAWIQNECQRKSSI